MKYRTFLLLVSFLVYPHFGGADELMVKANKVLSTPPEVAAKEAISKNDLRFLHTPVCAEGMPGFNYADYRGVEPNPKEIWSTCAGLMGEERYQLLQEMEKWVESYNRIITEHRK